MAQVKVYVLPTEPRVQSRTALFAGSGKNLPVCHYIPRGGDSIAPEAWVSCGTTEACIAPSRQRCREQSKPKPSKSHGVDTVGIGNRGKGAGCGPGPIGERKQPGQGTQGVDYLPITCMGARGDLWFDAYVEAHME